MNRTETPPELSQATRSGAAWFNQNAHRYAPADRELFHKLFGLVTEPLHILVLDEELRRRMFSERDSGMDPTQESKFRVGGEGVQIPISKNTWHEERESR